MVSEKDLSGLNYYILPGKPRFDSPYTDLHNTAYEFWASFWQKILQANGTTETINPDEFLRQSFITCLLNKGIPIGMHCYTMFDLERRSDREHSYFRRFYTEKSLAMLAKRDARHVLTMEYFSVDKDWRAGRLGLSVATILACLGLKIGREIGADAVISAARADNASAKIGQDLGSVDLDTNVMIYNTPCNIIAFYEENIRFPADLQMRRLLDLFWERRIDTTTGDQQLAQLPVVA